MGDGSDFSSSLYPTTEDALARGVPVSQVEEYKRYAYQQAFGIDRWYAQLERHTFQTWFLSLTAGDVDRLLSGAAQCRAQKLDAVRRSVMQDGDDGLGDLRGRLQAIFDEVGEPVFVKMNTRSPKDVVMDAFDDEQVVGRVLGKVSSHLRSATHEQDPLSRLMTAFVTSCTDILCCEDAAAALALLLRSRRMVTDLTGRGTARSDRFIWATVHAQRGDVSGIWIRSRMGKGGALAMLAVDDAPTYRKRFRFHDVAMRHANLRMSYFAERTTRHYIRNVYGR